MKTLKEIDTREADLSFEELEELAEEIRIIVTGGEGCTIREYVNKVVSLDVKSLGYRRAKALIFEPKLESYFPDSVFVSLREKAREWRGHTFTEDDDLFILKNNGKGIDWLKRHFYDDGNDVFQRAIKLGVSFAEDEYENENRVDGGLV
jgi:hypothetical protein